MLLWFLFWRSGKCGVSFHSHYSKVHSVVVVAIRLLLVKLICLNIIHIRIDHAQKRLFRNKKYVDMNIKCTSLSVRHKVTLDGLTFRLKQSIDRSSNLFFFSKQCSVQIINVIVNSILNSISLASFRYKTNEKTFGLSTFVSRINFPKRCKEVT